jgi:hypothetical protein
MILGLSIIFGLILVVAIILMAVYHLPVSAGISISIGIILVYLLSLAVIKTVRDQEEKESPAESGGNKSPSNSGDSKETEFKSSVPSPDSNTKPYGYGKPFTEQHYQSNHSKTSVKKAHEVNLIKETKPTTAPARTVAKSMPKPEKPVFRPMVTELTLRSLVPDRTFHKAWDYYRWEWVSGVRRDGNTIYGTVRGHNGNVYSPWARIKDGAIDSDYCDCMAYENYPGPCKHILALILTANAMGYQEEKPKPVEKTKPVVVPTALLWDAKIKQTGASVPKEKTKKTSSRMSSDAKKKPERKIGKQKSWNVTCPECGNVFSGKEKRCPECGYPTALIKGD